MAYAAAADLFARHDVRSVNDLANDDGARQSRLDLATNVNVAAALDDASGEIDAAILAGKRYTSDDLTGLSGNALAWLKRITCDLAMSFLYDRRPAHNVDQYERYHQLAESHLEKLRTGENVFNLAAQQNASLPTINGPTSVDYARLNLIPDRVPRYFPSRSSRLPTDRG